MVKFKPWISHQHYTTFDQLNMVLSLSSSFYLHQSLHLVRCHATGINYLLISFLHALCSLNLSYQVINLIWLIISGSQSSKISSSRLMFFRFKLRKVYLIAKECNNSRVYFTKDYIIIRKYSIIKNFQSCHV